MSLIWLFIVAATWIAVTGSVEDAAVAALVLLICFTYLGCRVVARSIRRRIKKVETDLTNVTRLDEFR